MKYGDLSNVVSPRIIIVFEGAVGSLPDGKTEEYDKAVKKNNWFRAARLFDLNELMLQKLLYLSRRKNINISLVTWMPDDAAMEISDMMHENSVPVRGCFSSTPAQLARMLPYNPDVACVYDPVPEHILMFGSKGEVLTDPNQVGRMF